MLFRSIKNRDHGQSLDDGALIWDYLFSGVRRKKDGSIVNTGSVRERKGDAFAMAFAAEKRLAWQNNSTVEMPGKAVRWEKLKYHGLDGGQKVRGAYICVPVSTLAGFFEAQCVYSENRLSACLLLKDGRTLQFARGSIGCVIDRELTARFPS